MSLGDLMNVYTGNACITIDGYCEEMKYDYYTMPDEDEEAFSSDNPNHYTMSCIAKESWYEQIKDRTIAALTVIGGGMYKTEMYIKLENFKDMEEQSEESM